METMTLEPATRAREIKTAINSLEKDEWTEKLLDMLDEMELDRRLEISLAQADRGEDKPAEEAIGKVLEDLRTGKIFGHASK